MRLYTGCPTFLCPAPRASSPSCLSTTRHAGRGLDTQLLESVKQEAQARGCTRLSLINLRDRESYQRGFYAKLGWQERPDAANFIFRVKQS